MFRRIFAILIFILALQDSYATHIVGGEITYTHVAGNTYEVVLTVYRDDFAAGAAFDNPATIHLYTEAGVYVQSYDMTLDNPAAANNHLTNPYPNPCLTIPPNILIQKGVYTLNITVPDGTQAYEIMYGRCCRNAIINNLNNPNDQGSMFAAHIPPTTTYSNSTPTFDFVPPIFICLGNPLDFVQSATDIDGDSLFYNVCTPLTALSPTGPAVNSGAIPPAGFGPPFDPIVWQAPYNTMDQLGGTPLTIDPNTGLLAGIPNTLGTFVVGLCVEEWRGGVLMSTVLRDFQYTVSNCNVPAAAIPIVGSTPVSSIPGAPSLPTTVLGIYEKNCDNLTIDFDNTSTLPGGGTATATNASYFWDFGDGDTSDLFEPSHTFPDTGTFIVKAAITVGVGAGSCSDTGYYVVFVYPVFTPDFQGDDACANDTANFIDLSTTAAYDNVVLWEWDFGDGSPTSGLQNPSHHYNLPGIYEVILFARTDKGCTKLDTSQITIHHVPNPVINMPNPVCEEDTVDFVSFSNVALGSVDSLYWNFGIEDTSDIIDPSIYFPNDGIFPIQLYTVSNFGCRDSITQNLVINSLPIVTTSGNDTICPNTSIQVNATGGVTYLWTPPANLDNANINNPTITPILDQYYYVEVTDANNCINNDSLFIGLKPPPPAYAGEDTSVCLNITDLTVFNSTVPLQATGGLTYAWTPPAGLSDTSISNPIASPSLTTDYIVTVFDAQNCSASDTVQVVVLNPALELIQVTTDSLCFGDTVVVDVLDQGAITSYAWTPTTFVTDPNANEPGFYPPTNTQYTLTVQNYCYQDEDSVLIEVIPLPILDAGPLDSVCMGDSPYQLSATPNDLEIYQWTSTDLSISDASIFNPTVQPNTTSMYYLNAVDSVGTLACKANDSVQIIVYDIPTLGIQFPANYSGFICQGDNVLLDAVSNNATIYNWDADASLSSLTTQTTFAAPLDTTEYFVTVENTHGCVNRDSIIVNVQSPVNPSIAGDSIMCVGFYVDLEASGGLYYQWYPAEANFSNSSYNITQAYLESSIQIFVDVSNDCFHDTLYKNITVHPLPAVDAGVDFTIIRDDEPGFLDGSGDGKPLWYTDNLNFYGIINSPAQYGPEVQPEVNTNYVLEIENPVTGCKNYDTMTVFVDVVTLLAFPTGFTPNADGTNDLARIIKYLNIKNLDDFSIYNRFGERVFTTTDLNGEWDGTYKGVPQEMGVYAWLIKAVTKDNEPILKKGNITLIR